MDAIEIDRFGEDEREVEYVREEDRQEEEKDTSFIENTNNANAEFDNMRTQINSATADQTRVNTGIGEDGFTDLEREIQNHAVRKAVQRCDAIKALDSATDTRFIVKHGESSKERV